MHKYLQTLTNKQTVFNAYGFFISQASLTQNGDPVVRENDKAVTKHLAHT